ncbi:hypothetical protein [Variovorax paradoxus]|uniref:hypothetical protein n=1 Tax=Variovorax paradoxus TaxID=34073 RepID=UPI003AAB3318
MGVGIAISAEVLVLAAHAGMLSSGTWLTLGVISSSSACLQPPAWSPAAHRSCRPPVRPRPRPRRPSRPNPW